MIAAESSSSYSMELVEVGVAIMSADLFASGPHLNKPNCILDTHALVRVLEEILLDLSICQAHTKLIRHPLLSLVGDAIAARALLREAADFCLPTKPGRERTDWLAAILRHP